MSDVPTQQRGRASSAYRVSDLYSVPGLLSLSRVALAAAFPFVITRPALAFAIMAVAALSDAADGWYARRFGLQSATGAVLDPITDKLFVATVAITLVVTGHLSWSAIVLLSTRELGELPLLLWLVASPAARHSRLLRPSANWIGKLATVLQFGTIAAALLRARLYEYGLYATAVVGAAAAVSYWLEVLHAPRVTR